MWDEGIEMAKTAYALDEALESGDTGRIIELSELLSQQVKNEVSSRAEAEGWYEEYDRATSAEHWQVETTVDPYGPIAFPMKVVPAEREVIPDRALQRLRREAGFRSAADFAKASGLPVGKYARYERGPVDDIPADGAAMIAKQLAASGVQVPSWLSERADKVSFDRDLIEKGLEQGLIQVEPEDDVSIRVSIGDNWFWARMPEELGLHADRHFSDFAASEFTDTVMSALADLSYDPDDYAVELAYYDAYLRENVKLQSNTLPSHEDRDTGVSLKGESEAMRESATQLGGGDAPSKPDPQR